MRRTLLTMLFLAAAAGPLAASASAEPTPALAQAAPLAVPTQAPAFLSEDEPLTLREYQEPITSQKEEPWWQQLFGFLFKLALVVGLIYLSLMAVRKFGNGQISLPSAKGRNLVVLESTHLAPSQAIHLVSLAGERLLVVGASPQGLTTLSEITDPAQIAPILSAQRGSASPFNQVFDLESVVHEAESPLLHETLREVREPRPRPDTEWPRA